MPIADLCESSGTPRRPICPVTPNRLPKAPSNPASDPEISAAERHHVMAVIGVRAPDNAHEGPKDRVYNTMRSDITNTNYGTFRLSSSLISVRTGLLLLWRPVLRTQYYFRGGIELCRQGYSPFRAQS